MCRYCVSRSTQIVEHMPYKIDPLNLIFQALADPGRRGIVERLCRGPASVSELARPLSMSLPSVMQHLQVLEDSGLIRSQKTGRVRTCRIDPKALQVAEMWIGERRSNWEHRLDRLSAYLAVQKQSDDSVDA